MREKKGDGGEGRGGETSLIDECFEKADVITECLFSVTALMTKMTTMLGLPLSLVSVLPLFMLMTQLPMLG